MKAACRGSKTGRWSPAGRSRSRRVDSRDSLISYHLLALEFHRTASRLCSGIADRRRPAINTTNPMRLAGEESRPLSRSRPQSRPSTGCSRCSADNQHRIRSANWAKKNNQFHRHGPQLKQDQVCLRSVREELLPGLSAFNSGQRSVARERPRWGSAYLK